MIDILLNPFVLAPLCIALGVAFDEFFTTKFSRLTFHGRVVLRDLKDKL